MNQDKILKTFVANGIIDIFRKIYKKKKTFWNKVLAFRTLKTEEIDNIDQFNYLSYLIKKKINNEKTKNISINTQIPAPGTF